MAVEEPMTKAFWPATSLIDKVANGVVVPTPTLLLVASTESVLVSTVSVLLRVVAPVTSKVPETAVLPVKVEAPVTSRVPPVVMLVPMVVVATTIPAVAKVAITEATITWSSNFELINFFIVLIFLNSNNN